MEKDISFLEQMAKSMEELEGNLENYFKKSDAENFNKTKKTMIDIQKKILEAANAN